MLRPQPRNRRLASRKLVAKIDAPEILFGNNSCAPPTNFSAWRDLNFCVLNSNQQRRRVRGCRSVELRALCNEVPRTPPGPEGSNGIGIASGAADHPKFLALEKNSQSILRLRSGQAVESRK